jgi:hypothetical protein
MELGASTSSLLALLDRFSGGKLTRRDDLGFLIELANVHRRTGELDELSFLAKFLMKSRAIMARIGPEGDGYERLSREFSDTLPHAQDLLRALLQPAPEDVHDRFENTYLLLTPDALTAFLALAYDLSWYKNWRLDHP